MIRALFLSTPSARRATDEVLPGDSISIFLSTPSARRATTGTCSSSYVNVIFLSTPSARRATLANLGEMAVLNQISIHALREEGDGDSCVQCKGIRISIHALREEGDQAKKEMTE